MTKEEFNKIINQSETIFLDFDGVIAKSIDGVCNILNEKYNKSIKPQEIMSWNFDEYGKDLSDDDVENIFNSNKFLDVLEPQDGALEFIEANRDKIMIVTKGGASNALVKEKWLKSYGFGDIPVICLPLSVSKKIIDMRGNIFYTNRGMIEDFLGQTVFIDDSTYNLKDTNATHKIQFREYDNNPTWQQGWNGDYITSWK